MLLRAILFSSDEQIAQTLAPVFAEFGVEVEPCSEIFAAVERMTTGGFDAVVADWSEELEASFFLKTARELKCVKDALALAVVQQKDVDEAFQLGVDGVLIKPLTSAQVRNALLTVGRFNPPQPLISPFDSSSEHALPQCNSVESLADVSRAVITTDEPPLFSSLAPLAPLTPSHVLSFSKHAHEWAERVASKARGNRVFPVALLTTILAVISLAWYAGSLPDTSVWTSTVASWFNGVGSIFRDVASPPPNNLLVARCVQPVPAPFVTRSEASTSSDERFAEIPEGEIEVKPILPPVIVSTIAEPRPVNEEAAILAEPETEAPDKLPPLRLTSTPAMQPRVVASHIPASLFAPVQEITGKTPVSKAAAAARWIMQPVSLPEDVARGLVIHQVSPIYPVEALKAGVEGVVVLQALVGKDGSIQELKLVDGYMIFGRAAFDAVKQWRFEPYRLNGEFVNMQTLITLNFKHPQP